MASPNIIRSGQIVPEVGRFLLRSCNILSHSFLCYDVQKIHPVVLTSLFSHSTLFFLFHYPKLPFS